MSQADISPDNSGSGDDGWSNAISDFYQSPDNQHIAPEKKEEEKPDSKPDTGVETPKDSIDTSDKNTEQPEKKDDGENTETPEEKPIEEPTKINPNVRDMRMLSRESQKELESIKSDIRSKMYADIPQQLLDADGDPINSIEDVMRLINPQTGEAFTEQEAGMWLLAAQQRLNQSLAEMDKNVEKVAELNASIKDQADYITEKYGSLLESNTELRDKLWLKFEKTLVKDQNTGIITDMPISLQEFYELALEPHVLYHEQQKEIEAKQKEIDENAKKIEEQKQKQNQADRADIYGNANVKDDPEAESWDKAYKNYYGG